MLWYHNHACVPGAPRGINHPSITQIHINSHTSVKWWHTDAGERLLSLFYIIRGITNGGLSCQSNDLIAQLCEGQRERERREGVFLSANDRWPLLCRIRFQFSYIICFVVGSKRKKTQSNKVSSQRSSNFSATAAVRFSKSQLLHGSEYHITENYDWKMNANVALRLLCGRCLDILYDDSIRIIKAWQLHLIWSQVMEFKEQIHWCQCAFIRLIAPSYFFCFVFNWNPLLFICFVRWRAAHAGASHRITSGHQTQVLHNSFTDFIFRSQIWFSVSMEYDHYW